MYYTFREHTSIMDTGRLLFVLPAGRRTDGKRLIDAMVIYHLHISLFRYTVQSIFGLRLEGRGCECECLFPPATLGKRARTRHRLMVAPSFHSSSSLVLFANHSPYLSYAIRKSAFNGLSGVQWPLRCRRLAVIDAEIPARHTYGCMSRQKPQEPIR